MLHARIAPSALARTVKCNGWVQLAEALPPEPDTPESLEGTAGHEAALMLGDGFKLRAGDQVTNNHVVTEEMIEGAELWIETITRGAMCEIRLPPITRIHPTDCWGTPDAYFYDEEHKVLRVWDYKFGHRFVEVYENWQLIAYAIGILQFLQLPESTELELCIVQPRSYHPSGVVRTWKVNAVDLRAHVNIAMQAAHRALSPDAPTVAGPHCLDCPVRGVCRTAQAAGAEVVDWVGRPELVHLRGAALSYELSLLHRAAKLVEARVTGLEEQARALIGKGESVPGISIERTMARLTWKPDTSVPEVKALGDILGVQLLKDATLITPTQAIKKGVAEPVIAAYSWRPPGSSKLVFDPDNTQARKAFGAIKQ